ncbi:MAG: hypothetical protein JWP41_232 [Ramlibacter sp.]|nr:hypothetical protein [Ramlibacter sp.]
MTISLYSASVPVFQHMLKNLSYILEKAEAYATARKIDPVALTTFRLAPDMLPFTRQVLIACDAAKNGTARVSGVEAPKFEDNEATFADLRARIQKTQDYLATVPASAVDGKEDAEFTFPVGPNTRTMNGQAYLTTWVLPNFFFHITTAYAILRHNGVDVGKADYLAGAR